MRKILFVAIAAVMVCGCVNNDCSEMLPVRELFGAKLDEPWGGELALNDLGYGGADYVSEWQDLEQSYVVWTNDVLLSRFCGRGYYYSDTACDGVGDLRRGGPFDGKDAWMVSMIADKSTGMILEVYGCMSFSTHRYRRGYEDDCVRKNGARHHMEESAKKEFFDKIYINRKQQYKKQVSKSHLGNKRTDQFTLGNEGKEKRLLDK